MKRSGKSRPARKARPQEDYNRQLRAALARYLPTRGLPLIQGALRWSDRLLVLVALLMAFSPLGTLQDRFAEARQAVVGMYGSRRRPGRTYAGFSARLVGVSPRLLGPVVEALQRHLIRVAGADAWRVGRHLAFAGDGSQEDLPRTKANRRRCRPGGKKKSGPQQLLVSVLHVGTGLLWSWRRGPARSSERGLLLAQLAGVPAGALLLLDAGFTGHEVLTAILTQGLHVLVRAGANVRLLRKLGWTVVEKGHWVYLWPQALQGQGQPPLVLRKIVLIGRRNRRICLLTDLLEDRDLTVAEAGELYRRRWDVELLFRGLKQTLDRRKMLSGTPDHGAVELDWTVAAYGLLGLLLYEQRPEKVSATQGLAAALRLVRQALAGRGDRRRRWAAGWEKLRVDRYVRLRPKRAWCWPHKKNDPPCRTPQVRMATPTEVRRAKRLALLCRAA